MKMHEDAKVKLLITVVDRRGLCSCRFTWNIADCGKRPIMFLSFLFLYHHGVIWAWHLYGI